MKKCINCGTELNDIAKFCRKCGTKQEQVEKFFCENCGAELSADAEFCENCGTKVIKVEPQASGGLTLNFGAFSNAEIETAFDAGIATMQTQSEESSLAMFDYYKAPNGEITVKNLLNKIALRVEIPEGVTAIADNAFENAIVTEVKLPQSLIYIGKRAFAGCANLMQLSIPQNVAIIDDEAFADDTELEITIPATVKKLGVNVILNTKPDIRQKKEEAERKAREEAERKAKEEAERKAREEAERKAREEAERRAKEEAERIAREKAEHYKIGKIIDFGSYPYDKNGNRKVIKWRILDRKGNHILVTSQYALDCQKYNSDDVDVTWENCSLRKWLNGTFLNEAFNSVERSMILSSKVSADENPKYSTNPGNATTDKIFLLSIAEAEKYLPTYECRKCVPTEYAISHCASTSSEYTKGGAATCWWWLRSPGTYQSLAACVHLDGSVCFSGLLVRYVDVCVRPALWINLDS